MNKNKTIIEIIDISFEVETNTILDYMNTDDIVYYEENDPDQLQGFNYSIDLEELDLKTITLSNEVIVNDTKYKKGDTISNIVIVEDEDIKSEKEAREYIHRLLFLTMKNKNKLTDKFTDLFETGIVNNIPDEIVEYWNQLEVDENVEVEFYCIEENDYTIN